jgi:uncharacterized protein
MNKRRTKILGLAVAFLAAAFILLPPSSKAFAEGYKGEYVVDNAGLLSYDDADRLESWAKDLSQKHRANVVILTENEYGDSSQSALQNAGANTEIEFEYAYVGEYYDEAYGVNKDGVICYVNMADRFVVIDSTGKIQRTFDGRSLDEIRDDVIYYLSAGYYNEAFERYLTDVDEVFDEETMLKRTFRIFSAVGSAVVSALVVGVSKSKMNTARKQTRANRYQKPGSMKLTRSSDIYLYSNISRVKRSNERRTSGGGGGGGGHFSTSGGGSHTSSGGHF